MASKTTKRAIEFRMAKGKPFELEHEVNRLISSGFTTAGETYEYVIPGTADKIFVQPMVKFEETE